MKYRIKISDLEDKVDKNTQAELKKKKKGI